MNRHSLFFLSQATKVRIYGLGILKSKFQLKTEVSEGRLALVKKTKYNKS